MNRDKQIEEMAELIYKETDLYNVDTAFDISTVLHDADYRKASEVALEVIGEIEKIIDKHYNNHIFGNNDLDDLEHEAIMNFSADVTNDIDDLKKKYTEGER